MKMITGIEKLPFHSILFRGFNQVTHDQYMPGGQIRPIREPGDKKDANFFLECIESSMVLKDLLCIPN